MRVGLIKLRSAKVLYSRVVGLGTAVLCPIWLTERHARYGRSFAIARADARSCLTSLAVAGRGDEDLGGAVLRGRRRQPAAPK